MADFDLRRDAHLLQRAARLFDERAVAVHAVDAPGQPAEHASDIAGPGADLEDGVILLGAERLEHDADRDRPRHRLAAVDREFDIVPRVFFERTRHEYIPRRRLERFGDAVVGDASLPEREHEARRLETWIDIAHDLPSRFKGRKSNMQDDEPERQVDTVRNRRRRQCEHERGAKV